LLIAIASARVQHAENVELPDATHCMLQSNPKGAAELLADFFTRHPLRVIDGNDRAKRSVR
jgi:pimeloyl-ACP methyl ester carboxylesterase